MYSQILKIILFGVGIVLIESTISVLKGFYFYRSNEDADIEIAKKSWKNAKIKIILALFVLVLSYVILYFLSLR